MRGSNEGKRDTQTFHYHINIRYRNNSQKTILISLATRGKQSLVINCPLGLFKPHIWYIYTHILYYRALTYNIIYQN